MFCDSLLEMTMTHTHPRTLLQENLGYQIRMWNYLLALWLPFISLLCSLQILSELELKFTFAICRRLSVCRLSVTFVRPTQTIEIFGNVSMPFGTLAFR